MVRGRGERGWNYRVQRASSAHTNDNSINYFIQYFLYLQVCIASKCSVPICCVSQALHACRPCRDAHAQQEECISNLLLGEKKH